MIRRRRLQSIHKSIAAVFECLDAVLGMLVTFHQRLVLGLFMIVHAISGLPAASPASRSPAIALDLIVRGRPYSAMATLLIKRGGQTFDFLCRQEKQATVTGVPRRLPVADCFMESLLW